MNIYFLVDDHEQKEVHDLIDDLQNMQVYDSMDKAKAALAAEVKMRNECFADEPESGYIVWPDGKTASIGGEGEMQYAMYVVERPVV